MNSSKVILDKIINDNTAIINENIKRANDTASEIISKAQADADAQVADFKSGLKAEYNEILRRGEVVANLDAKKILMSAKSKAVDNLFQKTFEQLALLDKKKYLAIIENLLKKYAEDGDVVIISSQDKGKITQKFVDDIAKNMGIKLSLAKDFGSFNGGVILAGKNSDKNLSFDMELLQLREECETQISSMLFEE